MNNNNNTFNNGTVSPSSVGINSFIDTFCAVNQYSSLGNEESRGISFSLEKFTPCFNDLIVIGGSDIFVIIFGIVRLYYLYSNKFKKYKMKQPTKTFQILKIVLSFIAAMVSLVQLSGRIGATEQTLAPYEYVSFALSLFAFLFLGILYLIELQQIELRASWMLNFVVLLELAGHTVKLYYLIELLEKKSNNTSATIYFTGVFILKYICVAVLGLLALCYIPSDKQFTEIFNLDGNRLTEANNENDLLVDDEGFTKHVCPEQNANICSRLTFEWMGPLMKLGHERPLEKEDVWMLPQKQSAQVLQDAFLRNWKYEQQFTEKPSLFRALRKTYIKPFIVAGFFKIFNDASQFVGPLFIGLFIQFIASQSTDTPMPQSLGYVYSFCIFGGQLIGALAENQYFQTIMTTGLNVRSVLISSIFKIALTLSAKGRHGRSAGKTVNLMSSDAEGLQSAVQGLWNAWSAPIRIIVALILLYSQLGWATFIGVFILGISIPIQKQFVMKSMLIFRATAKVTDRRLKYENELFASMNVVKMYAWEDSFKERIDGVRTNELGLLWKAKLLQMWNSFFINAIPIFVTVVTFAIYASFIGNLNAEKAFTSIAYFAVLRYPLYQLPAVINQIVNARVMIERIEEFLLADVLEEKEFKALPKNKSSSDSVLPTVVKIHDKAEFAWNIDQKDPSLSQAGFEVKKGQFVSIIGGTGQGKSTLLNAILGELPTISGHKNAVTIYGSIAYVPQESWVFNATLRENILFGLPYDEEKYNNAVHVARMEHDLQMMPAGDSTELGEKGVNLSGGQRQRLSIARAVYADADVYLFDDPLSALDAKVAREVFDMCIDGHLKGKTVILVTNRVEFISKSDNILIMNSQKISAMGTYNELMENSEEFKSMMHNIGTSNDAHGDNDTEVKVSDDEKIKDKKEKTDLTLSTTKASEQKKNDNVAKLIAKETRRKGSVSWSTITSYIQAIGGNGVVFGLVFSYILGEIFRLSSSYWLKFWSADTFSLQGTATYLSTYIGIFALFSAIQALLGLFTNFFMNSAGLRGSRKLHDGMVNRLLRAPMSFFHSNPHGRIINRFTKDITDIDKLMIMFTSMVLRAIVQLSGTLIIIGAATPYTLLTFVPVFCVFYFVQRYFQETSRELKRLDATTRSPIYAHFSECLNGISNIRAYKRAKSVNKTLGKRLNSHLRMNLAQFSANRWLSVRLELLGGSLVLFSCIFVVIGYKQIDAAGAGMQLSFALQITGLLNMLVRLSSLAENSFNAVERIKEYSDVNEEQPTVQEFDEALKQNQQWPMEGNIKYNNVVARYRADLPPVLNGLTFDIKAEEKVGLVGRTGAGKSSLFLTLFRIVERDDGDQDTGGSITIDGVDISSVGLKLLRDSISIIPQEPVLFVGTIRFNLDPFNQYTDVAIWRALDNAHMKKITQASGQGLDMAVEENGSNFSVGQRQLLCLARALLKNSKILVLDEATAAVDVETDHLIQATIRKSFSHCSTLTIAHRLDTIIDSDRVLVLDKGTALEFDTPKELLNNPKYSAFAAMVKETGAETEKYLRSIANGEISYENQLEEKMDTIVKDRKSSLSSEILSRKLSLSNLDLVVREDGTLSTLEKVTNALVVLREVLTDDGVERIQAELSAQRDVHNQTESIEHEWYAMLSHNLQKLNSILGKSSLNIDDGVEFNRESFGHEELLVFSNTR